MTIFLTAALAAAVVGVGCGGDDEGTSGGGASGAGATGGAEGSGGGETTIATSSLDQEEFIKRASAICREARADLLQRVAKYAKSVRKGGDGEAVTLSGATKAVVLPNIEDEIAQIRELGAPEGDEEEIEVFLVGEEEAIAAVSGLDDVISRFQIERHFAPSGDVAREYGIGACAND